MQGEESELFEHLLVMSDTLIMTIVFTMFSTFTSQKHKNNNKKGCLGNKSKSLRERKAFSKYRVQKSDGGDIL